MKNILLSSTTSHSKDKLKKKDIKSFVPLSPYIPEKKAYGNLYSE
jgi:hypothetical protein